MMGWAGGTAAGESRVIMIYLVPAGSSSMARGR
jgi:hypothetical protein